MERRAVERDHARSAAVVAREQRIPVETGDDGVVDLEENALALLGGPELGSPGLHEALQVRGQGSELAHQAPQLDLGHRGGREDSEDPDLLLRPFVRLLVHDAERPEGVSLGGDQRDPRVSDHPELGRQSRAAKSGSSRASATTSGSRDPTACLQNECVRGVCREDARGSGSPH